MSQVFWQAKIWGLLHDPALKALHNNTGRGGNSFWRDLSVMSDWVENDWNPEVNNGKAWNQIHMADFLASSSDRGAIGAIVKSLNYNEQGLEVSHLLSAAKVSFQLKSAVHQKLMEPKRGDFLNSLEDTLLPDFIRLSNDPKQVFWWLWRCLPQATCEALENDTQILLAPAETRLPDSSIWSHTSLTAAFAGALAGYDLKTDELRQWPTKKAVSHAYLAAFSFTPVQELIKASRKMRDFWAGSWLLHYLSAKVSWTLAQKYGPDSLLYPSLFQQPLIDHWLLDKWPEFTEWIDQPSDRQLLTAGFPNVIIMILPKAKVQAAMQLAEQTLKEEWLKVGQLALEELNQHRGWMSHLVEAHKTWNGWLGSQWQCYWSAVAIGKEGEDLKNAALEESQAEEFTPWVDAQNRSYDLIHATTDSEEIEEKQARKLFHPQELNFLRNAYAQRLKQGRRFSVNVGSWWPYVFTATRRGLAGVKNARTWSLPTAFSVRSTISGLGPAVHNSPTDWIAEGEVKQLWERHAGLFDGSEQLNATEAVKRVLHKTLPKLLQNKIKAESVSYPDLTAGVAGYLKTQGREAVHGLQSVYQEMQNQLSALGLETVLNDVKSTRWGIPWADRQSWSKRTHSRYLNVAWLLQDFDEADDLTDDNRSQLQQVLDRYYPSNKPGDWYVLAAGDGDGLSEWLKGSKLKPYRDYIPQSLHPQKNQGQFKDEFDKSLDGFLNQKKRMGPSTHAALSRALLDFSNKLVPYLTEERYAGRLIYSGGDDVLAYTNLWEWDQWLWDIRQCFRGDRDPRQEFDDTGDYWRWKGDVASSHLPSRPLFTMGHKATISFGIVIAHHSVPLAIALEQLWKAEAGAKDYKPPKHQETDNLCKKNAVQVRVLYGNGNILTSTSPFPIFAHWQELITSLSAGQDSKTLESLPPLFESAATLWQQHPAPVNAIRTWVTAFIDRRDYFQDTDAGRQTKKLFEQHLTQFLYQLSQAFDLETFDQEVDNWLKLAAFTLRKRLIKQSNSVGGVQ